MGNLIVEAGSTKTDWAIIRNGRVMERNQTTGMNPVTDPDFGNKLAALLKTATSLHPISSVYYYGAGCVDEEVNLEVQRFIRSGLNDIIDVEVSDDLLGACRSVSDGSAQLVCILGTGSNICYFDGDQIQDRIRSAGYLLGDEGSGFRIGQEIYLRLVRGLFSRDVVDAITKEAKLSSRDLVVELYSQKNPRSYLAGFTRWWHFLEPEDKEDIAADIFGRLVERMILPLALRNPVPVAFVGSVSFHFSAYIERLLKKYDIIATCFEKSPLDGLIRFHHENEY